MLAAPNHLRIERYQPTSHLQAWYPCFSPSREQPLKAKCVMDALQHSEAEPPEVRAADSGGMALTGDMHRCTRQKQAGSLPPQMLAKLAPFCFNAV